MSDQQVSLETAIRTVFDNAVDNEEDAHSIKSKMMVAGATFVNIDRLYNKFMIEAGLALSPEDRRELVKETLDGVYIESEEDFRSAVEAVVEAVQGANEASAASLIRAYAKREDFACYVKPEGNARSPFVSMFHSALTENPWMTEDEMRAIIGTLSEDHQGTALRAFSQHDNIRKLLNKVAELHSLDVAA